MDLQHKTVYVLHDGDSYEVIVDGQGKILEIWRYDGNCTSKPHFCVLDHLDDILKDRIYDRVMKEL